MKLVIAMIGENLHGRILSNALTTNNINHKCIIEKNTKRSIKRENWLSSANYGPTIQSEKMIVDNIEDKKVREVYYNLDGFVINGGLPILKQEILCNSACKFLNVHPGLLPFYRGQNPVQWSVRNLAPIGASVHFIDEGIDTGPILLKKELVNFKSKSIRNLRIEVLKFSASLLVKYLKNPNKYPGTIQDPKIGHTYSAYFNGNAKEAEKRLAPLLKLYPMHKKSLSTL